MSSNNHQTKGAFKDLKVADIFMGGGTTVVEGSRLGMQMLGNDINPVAWFVVKNEMAQVDKAEVETLLADIETNVKPQIMPFYTCDCPRGHKGEWTQISTDKVMADDFDPLTITPEERKDYSYHGPEMIHTFWAKHGPCQVTGCGHRTPIMSSPVMAIKTLTVKFWARTCKHCGCDYDLEERDVRMAPSVSLVVADTERPFAVAKLNIKGLPECAVCPSCGKIETFGSLGKGKKNPIELSLLVHPEWLQGEPLQDEQGALYGGSVDDPVEETIRWNQVRAEKCCLIEIRGKLPDEIICPDSGIKIKTGKTDGTVPKRGHFTCGECGHTQDVRKSVKTFGKIAPVASYAVELYCPACEQAGESGNGRLFQPANNPMTYNSAIHEWSTLRESDLKGWWPQSPIHIGHEIGRHDIEDHHYKRWEYLFNARQLLSHAQLLRFVVSSSYKRPVIDFVVGAFQQFLRNQCMFSYWHISKGHFAPAFSNSNFNPRPTSVELGTFSAKGYGPWKSTISSLSDTANWTKNPWELVPVSQLHSLSNEILSNIKSKSIKVFPHDPLTEAQLTCGSSTSLGEVADATFDMVITDPPFSDLEQYAEMSDFFYVWLRLALKKEYPEQFTSEATPKALEAVANKQRHPDDPEGFYKRLMTECWSEVNRIIKPGGLLAFTFHHSEDEPWISVLESLFDAGFYLACTYPIRGDETKGGVGAQKIEYDIIHICRKRNEESKPISWAKLRRQVLHDVRDLRDLLEHHQDEGLPEADLQVIRRGKALEYFSRHYGKVYKDQDTPMSVLEALLGINQLLDEEAGGIKEAPPHNAEPFTRMLLRLFDSINELPRDQMQKFLRGTGSAPSDFANRGWVFEQKKVFFLTLPLDLAQAWIGKHRKGLQSDYD